MHGGHRADRFKTPGDTVSLLDVLNQYAGNAQPQAVLGRVLGPRGVGDAEHPTLAKSLGMAAQALTMNPMRNMI
jgi:hypothetical protein